MSVTKTGCNGQGTEAWYQFVLGGSPSNVELTITGSNEDQVSLISQGGSLIAGPGQTVVTQAALPIGQYYVKVAGDVDQPPPTFTLTIHIL